jgi:hypothetical protein
VDNVALLDPMAMEFAEAGGAKDPKKAAAKAVKEFEKTKRYKAKVKEAEGYLGEDSKDGDTKSLSALELILQEFRKFRITEFPEFLQKKFKAEPKRSIPLERAKTLKEKGDLSVLTQRFVMTPAAAR